MKRKITSLTTAIIVLFLMLISLPEIGWGQSKTTERVDLSKGTFTTDHITWTCASGNISITQLKGSSSTAVNSSYVSNPRVYKGHILSFVGTNNYKITSISITYDGNYYGNSMTAGTVISNNVVTNNTTDVSRTWDTNEGGTHVVSSVSNAGLAAIHIQNVASTNVQLRPTAISITYIAGNNNTVATPDISGETTFLTSTTVTITCGTNGASIQYSTDNGTNWTAYSTSFNLTETTTVKAKATKSGMTDSEETSKTFTKVTPMTVADALTTINALENNGTIDNQYVRGKISQNDGYNNSYHSITYWISDNGTTTSQLEVYSGKGLNGADFSAATDLSLGDIVVVKGTLKKYVSGSTTTPEFTANSQLVSITPRVKAPVFSPEAGAVAKNTNVTISTVTEDATIYYTTDGTAPTTSSSVYSAPITVNAAMTIKALAVKDGYPDSPVSEAAYTIALPCATPTFSVAEGEVEKGTSVTLSTETVGATIYYTTNGSTPTTSSTAYSSEITINSAMTIKAIAAKDGMANSAVASASYTVRDYVTLPFVWAGGTATALTGLSGVTGNSLGNYAVNNSNAPYCVQMNSTSDYILIKTDSKPSMVTIGVKMIGGATTSKIKVQESANGSTFNDVEEFTISGNQNDTHTFKTSESFATTTRYVKIIKSQHANGGNIGVGPITIDMSGSQTFTNFTIPANNTVTIVEGSVLTVTGALTITSGGSLIIEDGGQLICSNSVAATMKKGIDAASKEGEVYGWYAISSPVHTGSNTYESPSDVANLILTPANTYDLFYYNEPDYTWMNYKVAAFNLNKGQGYIYRNSTGDDLTFVGNTNVGNATYTLKYNTSGDQATLRGFNLIGNPYPHSIYKGTGTAIESSDLTSGFYTLSNSGSWTPGTDNTTEIKPEQGILVEAISTANDKTLTITDKTDKSAPAAKSNNDNIKFMVANSQYEDVAYALFDKGFGLSKINHRNADIPMLYINQEDADYAIATMSDDTKSFNLNFKAMTTGKYTLSYKADGNFSYLHVIDRLTGEDVDMLLEGEYSFIASPIDSENRFIVRLEYSAVSEISESSIFAYQSGSDIIVNGEGELQIFDMMGRRVLTQYVSGVETINLQLNGVYIFRLNEKTQKIVVK